MGNELNKQALVELTKIRKALTKEAKAFKKKAKKIKLTDILNAENINERINAFIDKLTLEDLLKSTAFISAVIIIYPIAYKLKPRKWWRELVKLSIVGWIEALFMATAPTEIEFNGNCLLVSIIVAYAVIYQGAELMATARLIVSAL